MPIHKRGETFQCKCCYKHFFQPESLTKHEDEHCKKVQNCDQCDHQAKNKWELKKHKGRVENYLS